jgi:hypothetical protein
MSDYGEPSFISGNNSEHFEDPPEPIPDVVTSASLPTVFTETEEPAKNVTEVFIPGKGFLKIKQEFPKRF